MQNRAVRIGPVTLGTAAANIANSGITSVAGPTGYTQTQPYLILTHVRILNKTNAAISVTLYLGATGGSAAGTETMFNATQIPPNGAPGNYVDWYGRMRMESTEFLTGLASAATAGVLTAEGEIGLT
jgi:hypothetical protein